jgi:photosystem II stability/assembly factor-like uncharacterized protein
MDIKKIILIVVLLAILLVIFGFVKSLGGQGVIGFTYLEAEKDKIIQNANFNFSKNVDIYQIIKPSSDPNLFFAATNHGIFFSQDGGKNWYPFSDSEKKINQDTIVYKIIQNQSSGEIFISAYQNNKGTIYQSNNNLFILNKLFEFNNDSIISLAIFRGNLYLGLKSGKILAYSFANQSIRQVAKLGRAISSLENLNDHVLYALSASTIFESFDGNKFVQNNDIFNVRDIAISEDNSTVYLVTKNSFLKSVNFGNTYSQITSLPLDPQKIEKIAASSANHIFVFGNQQFFESNNGGQSWKTYNSLLKRTVSTIKITNDKILVGTKSLNIVNSVVNESLEI